MPDNIYDPANQQDPNNYPVVPGGRPYATLADMFRYAASDPKTMAPGAPAYWASKLAGIKQEDDFKMGLDHARQTAMSNADTTATLHGISPQKQAEFDRNLETTKAGSPLAVANVNAGAQRDVATTNAGATTGAARIKGASDANVAFIGANKTEGMYNNLLSLLGGNGSGVAPGTHINLPGGGGFSTPAMPGSTQTELAKERAKLQGDRDKANARPAWQNSLGDFLGGDSAGKSKALDDRIRDIDNQMSGRPSSRPTNAQDWAGKNLQPQQFGKPLDPSGTLSQPTQVVAPGHSTIPSDLRARAVAAIRAHNDSGAPPWIDESNEQILTAAAKQLLQADNDATLATPGPR